MKQETKYHECITIPQQLVKLFLSSKKHADLVYKSIGNVNNDTYYVSILPKTNITGTLGATNFTLPMF